MSADPGLPGRARRAAETLIEVYRALGSHTDDYDRAWFAKEWLLDAADKLDDERGGR